MKSKIKTLLLLSTIFAGVATASAENCKELNPGIIDRSEHSLEAIKAGLVRGPWFLSWLISSDLNDSETFMSTFNEVCLGEIAYVLIKKENPYPSDEYINDLIKNNRLDPNKPETLALYIEDAQEPVTNPIIGQMASLVFERGAEVDINECFTFQVHVTTSSEKGLLYTLTVEKKHTWIFEVTALSREIVAQNGATLIKDEL
ncbi:MAG: hypothetical protein Tsb0018_00590 [Opitutales bacterium]